MGGEDSPIFLIQLRFIIIKFFKFEPNGFKKNLILEKRTSGWASSRWRLMSPSSSGFSQIGHGAIVEWSKKMDKNKY